MTYSRRNFLKAAGTGVITSGLSAGFTSRAAATVIANNKDPFRLAMAGYTFAKFDLDDTLVMMQRAGVRYLAIKDFHLPLDSPQEVIDETLMKLKSAGIEAYGVGPISMKTEAEVDRAFAYTRRVGVKILVAISNYDMLPYINRKVKEYDTQVAIHNHGPDTDIFSSASDIWKNIKALDARMGICLDIGHTTRLGLDCTEEFLACRERIFDMHICDIDIPDKKGKCVEAGRGIINFPAFVKALRKTKYSGTCSLEYWKDRTDPLPGITESIGYFRGVMAGLV